MDPKKAKKLSELVDLHERIMSRIKTTEEAHARNHTRITFIEDDLRRNTHTDFSIDIRDDFVEGIDNFIDRTLYLYLQMLYAKKVGLELEIMSM